MVYRSAAGASLGCWRTTIPNSSTNGTRSTFWPKSVAPPARGPVTANVVHSGTGGAAGVYAELLFEGREREREAARLVYEQYLAHLADAS